MQKVLLPKAKRLWLRRLLPVDMTTIAPMVMAATAKAVSRLQSPEVAAQALAATAVSRLQNLVSDQLPLKCP